MDVVYVGAVKPHVVPPKRINQSYFVVEPGALEESDFSIGIIEPTSVGDSGTMIIYAFPGILSVWNRLEQDIDRILKSWRLVVIVLIMPHSQLLDLPSHSYLLSAIISGLPTRKFITRIAVHSVAEPVSGPQTLTSAWIGKARRRLKTRFQRVLEYVYGGASPSSFSALAISVRRRT